MTSKQIINLAGGVLVLAIFVAALVLVAVPMYSDAQRISSQAQQVGQSNTIYEMQVQTLRAQEEDSAEITRAVDELTAEVPGLAQQSDVFELVTEAASDAGASIDSVVPAGALPWVQRIGPLDAGADPDAAALESDPTATADPAATAEGTEATGAEPAPTEPVEAEVPAEAQIPFVIIVNVEGADQATRFLDMLSSGPRLLSVIHSTLDDDGESLRLTVDALAYTRAQD